MASQAYLVFLGVAAAAAGLLWLRHALARMMARNGMTMYEALCNTNKRGSLGGYCSLSRLAVMYNYTTTSSCV